MAEGRSYTDSELKNGDFVAVVNVSECGSQKLGEMISIGGAEFEIIGKTYGQTTVPLFAAMREGFIDVEFSEAAFDGVSEDLGDNYPRHRQKNQKRRYSPFYRIVV